MKNIFVHLHFASPQNLEHVIWKSPYNSAYRIHLIGILYIDNHMTHCIELLSTHIVHIVLRLYCANDTTFMFLFLTQPHETRLTVIE